MGTLQSSLPKDCLSSSNAIMTPQSTTEPIEIENDPRDSNQSKRCGVPIEYNIALQGSNTRGLLKATNQHSKQIL